MEGSLFYWVNFYSREHMDAFTISGPREDTIKDQKSAGVVRKQLVNISNVIGLKVKPIYKGKKIREDFVVSEVNHH